MRRRVEAMLWGYASCTATVTISGAEHLVVSTAIMVVLVILLLQTDRVSAWLEKQDADARARRRARYFGQVKGSEHD